MSKPVGIITGAASGMGLALTRHLLSKGWKIAMADVNEKVGKGLEAELGPDVFFHRTDVSSWDDQAALFERAFKWGGDRLDFLAANAGIDDRQSLYERAKDPSAPPQKPNLKCIEVDLIAVYYGVWLFAHYARRNKVPGGKVVMTSSSAGIYPMDTNPQYTIAKHGLVGLARSAGPVFAKENITVNAILPAFVPTGLAPPGLIDIFPKEHVTPMSTVIKAFDTFLEDDSLSGETVELSQGDLFFRKKPDYPNESQRWLGEDSKSFWEEAYQTIPVRPE